MKERWMILALICATMIGVHLVNALSGGSLNGFGIHPRDVSSAYTIVTAPFLHGDFGHLGGNLVSFIVLAALCLLNGPRYFLKASALIIVLGGALVWLFGRGNIHIGASGWIFGLWSLVIAQAWFDRSARNFAIALGVVLFYGGMVFGVLPGQGMISFESHLFGAIAGVVAAGALARKRETIVAPQRTGELKFWPQD